MRGWLTVFVFVAAGAFDGCAAMPPGACVPGETRTCPCPNGTTATQSCNSAGTGYSACAPCGACTPSCGGRLCGSDGCGGSCGACSAGTRCDDALGRCVSGGGCTRSVGQSCAIDADCCASNGIASRCLDLWGFGRVCTASCTTSASCGGMCCARFEDNSMACAHPRFCADTSRCTRRIDESCTTDADCCADGTTGVPGLCTCVGASCTCRSMCRSHADCTSRCCSVRTDGTAVCSPPSLCGR